MRVVGGVVVLAWGAGAGGEASVAVDVVRRCRRAAHAATARLKAGERGIVVRVVRVFVTSDGTIMRTAKALTRCIFCKK